MVSRKKLPLEIAGIKIAIVALGISFLIEAINVWLPSIQIKWAKELFTNLFPYIYFVLGGWLIYISLRIRK